MGLYFPKTVVINGVLTSEFQQDIHSALEKDPHCYTCEDPIAHHKDPPVLYNQRLMHASCYVKFYTQFVSENAECMNPQAKYIYDALLDWCKTILSSPIHTQSKVRRP